MKKQYDIIKKKNLFLYGLIGILGIGIVIGVLAGCGKLNDDTDQPSSPIGDSGYSSIPYGPVARVGTFTLTVDADPASVPADQTNYSTITATLSNTSGLPVAGYTVHFSSETLFGWFYDPIGNLFVNGYDAITDQNGTATRRYYGSYSGQAVVRVEASIGADGVADLVASKAVTFTPGGPPNSAGSYSLELSASPSKIYANSADYSTIVATLKDSSGGSVENFEIYFEAELGYLSNNSVPPAATTGNSYATAFTNAHGSVSLYYYGARKGSAVISASVRIPDFAGSLPLEKRIVISVLEGPGVPGDGVAGIVVHASPNSVSAVSGTAATEQIEIAGKVWDATGDHAVEGVRVEFSGMCHGFAETDEVGEFGIFSSKSTGDAIYCTLNLGGTNAGTYTADITACTYGIVPQQQQYCATDTVRITITAAPTPTPIPRP